MFGFACDETPRADAAAADARARHHAPPRRRAARRHGAVPAARTARPRSRCATGATLTACPRPSASSASSSPRSTRRGVDIERSCAPTIIEHVVRAAILPEPARRRDAARARLRAGQPDRALRGRRPDGRRGPDRPQDHRRHLRRHGPPRRRRLLGQGSDEGRPLGRLRRALGGQERRRRGPRARAASCRSPTPSASRTRSASTSRRSARTASTRRRSSASCASTSTCARRRSCAISTCAARSTARRPRTATSAATRRASPGSAPIAPRRSRARSAPARPAPERVVGTIALPPRAVGDDRVRHDPAVSPPPTVRVVPLVTTRALREPLDYLAARGRRAARGDVVHVPLAGRSVRGVVVEAGGPAQHEGELAPRRAARRRAADRPGRAGAVPLDRRLLRLDSGSGAGARAAAARAGAERRVGLGHGPARGDGQAPAALLDLLADGPLPLAELVERARYDGGDASAVSRRTGSSHSTRGCACRAWRPAARRARRS